MFSTIFFTIGFIEKSSISIPSKIEIIKKVKKSISKIKVETKVELEVFFRPFDFNLILREHKMNFYWTNRNKINENRIKRAVTNFGRNNFEIFVKNYVQFLLNLSFVKKIVVKFLKNSAKFVRYYRPENFRPKYTIFSPNKSNPVKLCSGSDSLQDQFLKKYTKLYIHPLKILRVFRKITVH